MKILKFNILSVLFTAMISSPFSYGQWNQITFPSSEDLYMVRFVSETTGWVVGQSFVYKTINGGDSWETQDPVLGGGSAALYAIDSLNAVYADYSQSRIRRTSDGGASWYTADSEDYYYYDFKFINDLLGFSACGSGSSADSGIVRRTINGGITWTTIASVYFPNAGYDFEGLSFIDSLNGWTVSYLGWVYHTTDGGFNWSFQDSVGRSLFAEFVPCRDIQFTSLDSGWVVGGISGETIVANTTDGGLSWDIKNLYPFSSCSIKEIKMINSQIGWFAGAHNGGAMLAKTTNGGTNWVNQTPTQDALGFESISIINENVGYTVGRNGRIYKTINGGGITNISEENPTVSEFVLFPNYPNPFNPSTKISWQSPIGSHQTLKIYDVLGNEVATLVNEFKPAGSYEVEFYASSLSSGIYFYRLSAGSFVQTKKMILLK